MNTTIQKWGNSLAVRLPKEVVRKRALHEGVQVTVTSDKGRIVIIPAPRKEKGVKLASLVRDIDADNLHTEHVCGKQQGSEVW